MGSVANRRVWLRPGAHEMLRQLLADGFQLALSSTAKPAVMRALVVLAIPKDVASGLAFAWDRRWCSVAPGNELLKDLETVWRHEGLPGRFGPARANPAGVY